MSCLLSTVASATAQVTFTDGILNYKLESSSGGEVTVMGLNDTTVHELKIPGTIIYEGTEYPVRYVGNGAFMNSELTSVSFPAELTRVNNKSFDGCKSLREIIVEDADTPLYMGWSWAYDGDSDHAEGRGLFYWCPLREVYIGRNVNYMRNNSEGYSPIAKTNVRTITFGPKVTNIGANLVWKCDSLKEIDLSAATSLKTIQDDAFSRS